MKLPALVFVSLFVTLTLHAQTTVDRVVHALDSLGVVSYDGWKMSPDLKNFRISGDPTKPGFDDSKWETLKFDQRVYPDSCWLRREIALPERILGIPVTGQVDILLSVDDYGYLWVNGEDKGYFPWDGEFELTKNAAPGQKFLLVIKAINTGGPLRLLRAEVQSKASQPVHQVINDLSTSLSVGQKLLSFDTYQTNAHKKVDPHIDKSTIDRNERIHLNDLLQSLAGKIDLSALSAGELDRFTASVNQVRAQLKPVGEFARKFTLFFDANAHIDAAWLWRDKETIEVCKNTFSSVLSMMDARPDFTYTQSAAAYFDWMERLYPDVFRRIEQRVRDGRWEIVGGMWVEPDCNLPSGESWMHHLLYAKRYFKQKFGSNVTIGYNPDSFGYTWTIPEFYANAGIDAFITQKMGWSETNVFPYHVFWWQSLDGSRVLTLFPYDYVNSIDDPYRIVDQLRQFEANSGFRKLIVLFGVGDHGGGPTPEMLDRIEHLKTLDIYPTIEYGTAGQYLSWLRSTDLTKLPVWNDELYLEYHQGCYTTQAETKRSNRKDEVLLTTAEKFSTLATLAGKPYNGGDIEAAWRNVLFNQFHDILPGSGIRENYIDAAEKYKESEEMGNFQLSGALKSLADKVATPSKKGEYLVVFNPLSWTRSDVARFMLPEGDTASYAVLDEKGKECPSQIVRKDRLLRELLFMAKDVPSLGYATFQLKKQKPARGSSAVSASRTTLENEFLKVEIDATTGWVKSIFDKKNHRECIAGNGNELQLLDDQPKAWDAWNIGLTGIQFPTRLRTIELAEDGPVRATIRITRDYLKPGIKKDVPTPDYPSSFFTQEISLEAGSDVVDFATNADWWEDKTMMKIAFPVSVADTVASYEIPYGSITRSTQWRNSWDSAKVEVSAQRWGDLSQDDYGVSLLNNSKYGYDIKGHVMRLSLLRSPKWPDPTADRGKHRMEYAIYPHSGRWQAAATVRRGYEFNEPFLVTRTTAHGGTYPPARSFIRLEPSACVLSVVKQAEDSKAWVIQWYNVSGANQATTLNLPAPPAAVHKTNFLEEDGAAVPFTGKSVTVDTPPHAVVTLKIGW